MSWVRIWVHLIFSTKNRIPFLNSKEIREKVFGHIKENAEAKNIWLDAVNGYQEHAHFLISMNKEYSISKLSQLVKGESSSWINKNGLMNTKFMWQDDYWAVSVSESHLEEVRQYIFNQEEHHRKIPFSEEIEKFIEKYGWQFVKGN